MRVGFRAPAEEHSMIATSPLLREYRHVPEGTRMSDFTYQVPDERKYMQAILLILKRRGYAALVEKLRNATCSVQSSGSYSQVRWNGYYTTVVIQLPVDDYARYAFDDETEIATVLKASADAMPAQSGFDVLDVEFSPMLEDFFGSKSLEDELSDLATALEQSSSSFDLPQDILDAGKRMTEVYLYLYAVENYIRLFIERVAAATHGDNYVAQLIIPRAIQTTITSRKQQEERNQWMSFRGNSLLFYLDFKELGDIILNNWTLFQVHFPNQAWISSKIDELGNCRNLVAHNSNVDEHEIDVIRTNFKSIVRQLNPVMK
jgi:Swt1-like HEPN